MALKMHKKHAFSTEKSSFFLQKSLLFQRKIKDFSNQFISMIMKKHVCTNPGIQMVFKSFAKFDHVELQTYIFFAAKRHQICPQEKKRTPKELRASRSGKTVAREREPLHRLRRTASPDGVLRTAATNEQKNRTHLHSCEE